MSLPGTKNTLPFQPHGAARELWKARDEELLIEGPAGTGKTMAVLEKINFCLMKYPRSRGLIVRKTRASMTESVLVTFEEVVLPPGSPVRQGAHRKFRSAYHYPNGSELVVGGMDNPIKIMSTEYDIIGCFESTELTEEDFENLTTRLRNFVMPYQQIIADCNPDIPQHWLNRRPAKTDSDTGKPIMKRLRSRHWDNPVLYDHKANCWTIKGENYLKKLQRLSGARFQRLFKGIWAAQEGIVYDFDPHKHTCARFQIPAHWPRIRVIDFGFRDPFVCQWWAINPTDKDMYRYREIYMTGKLVEDHAREINELSEGERIQATVCDWDLEDRMTLERYGIPTYPAYKDILRGIEAVKSRLRIQEHNGEPRIFFMEDSLVERDMELVEGSQPYQTEDEFVSYVWKKHKEGKPIKEEPEDLYNHGMDTTRYAVAYVDNLASQRIQVTGGKTEAVFV